MKKSELISKIGEISATIDNLISIVGALKDELREVLGELDDIPDSPEDIEDDDKPTEESEEKDEPE